MIRPIRTILAVVFLAVGAALGALNPASITVDLGLFRFEAALGVVLLGVLLLGVLLGGLVLTVSVVLPMRHRHRRERMSITQDAASIAIPTSTQTSSQATTSMVAIRSAEPGGIEHGLHQ
jgi:lipopolysaccharide assembly protein A